MKKILGIGKKERVVWEHSGAEEKEKKRKMAVPIMLFDGRPAAAFATGSKFLDFKNTEYRCRGIQTNCEIDSGVRQQERCHRACNQLKIPSIELGSFSLGIEILWLTNGCENIGVAMVEYR
ncbi:hypothetical protein PIB30_097645 [Stylosanthes scabra]|uniref:Uncharacterized protein n=1 Tax=Stylosanthes scabra TaxID=79078 RepID=A0ABU6RX99_9FABA|nr:hypothetical protein [Stylosanthes scabra]